MIDVNATFFFIVCRKAHRSVTIVCGTSVNNVNYLKVATDNTSHRHEDVKISGTTTSLAAGDARRATSLTRQDTKIRNAQTSLTEDHRKRYGSETSLTLQDDRISRSKTSSSTPTSSSSLPSRVVRGQGGSTKNGVGRVSIGVTSYGGGDVSDATSDTTTACENSLTVATQTYRRSSSVHNYGNLSLSSSGDCSRADIDNKKTLNSHSTENVSVINSTRKLTNTDFAIPCRKPVINLGSIGFDINVISDSKKRHSGDGQHLFQSSNGNRLDLPRKSFNVVKRASSFKDGLNRNREDSCSSVRSFSSLSRTQSCSDGINKFKELSSSSSNLAYRKPLSRVPSVEEILESVKDLRLRQNMVKSTPDLYRNPCLAHPTGSGGKRSKSSKKEDPNLSRNSIYYNSDVSVSSSNSSSSSSSRKKKESKNDSISRNSEPHYEQIDENYYQNLQRDSFYENLSYDQAKNIAEAIYDCPKSNKPVQRINDTKNSLVRAKNNGYDTGSSTMLYENIDEGEPTYMNISDSAPLKVEERTNSSNSTKYSYAYDQQYDSSSTYDVPRKAMLDSNIYDTPKSVIRVVAASAKQSRKQNQFIEQECEYSSPKNNKSVHKVADQKKKIEDIFAEVDRDSLDGDLDKGSGEYI